MRLQTNIARINEAIEYAWSLVRDARVSEAREASEQLVQELQLSLESAEGDDKELSRVFAYACHVAGYTVSMSVRNYDSLVAVAYFQPMEDIARTLQDDSLLIIALTYKGDAYRRNGKLPTALQLLLSAYHHTPQNDAAALGNCAQLLGRTYFHMGDLENFEKLMAEAEQIAHGIDPIQNSLHGQYCLGTVYVDYARKYSSIGQTQKALHYLDLAEQALPQTPHWQTLLTATRGILLVKSGDFARGMPYVTQAVKLSNEHGNKRLIEHFYALDRYLGQQIKEISEARLLLKEEIQGPFTF